MKFKLSTVETGYKERQKKEYEDLGFTFHKNESYFMIRGEPEIEINTLEELMNFIDEHGEIIIREGGIKIYDGFL